MAGKTGVQKSPQFFHCQAGPGDSAEKFLDVHGEIARRHQLKRPM